MVYQEDVIKIAHYYGGLSLEEADMLRRGMSGKFRSREEFLKVKNRFFSNCKADGKAEEFTKDIWRQIESFASYTFAKGHSASYAVESYQSLFLKVYYPLEYMLATINNFGRFYGTELYIHEARMHGGMIDVPCINRSFPQTVIYRTLIYIGFMFLQFLESKTVQRILEEQHQNGHFSSLDNFIRRVSISMEQISILIKINTFRFTGINKRELLWEAHMKIHKITFEEPKLTLFQTKWVSYKTPILSSSELENTFDQIELLGFLLCNPFHLLKEKFSNPMRAKQLKQFVGKSIILLKVIWLLTSELASR